MSLTLYYHPLSSYCHKVLIALYEAGTAFNAQVIDLGDADGAAAPALFYATTLQPLPTELGHLRNYFARLMDRPSVRRVLEEARPYFHLYPFADAIPQRFNPRTEVP